MRWASKRLWTSTLSRRSAGTTFALASKATTWSARPCWTTTRRPSCRTLKPGRSSPGSRPEVALVTASQPESESFTANGINGATGELLLPPQTHEEVAARAAAEISDQDQQNLVRAVANAAAKPHLGALFDVDLTAIAERSEEHTSELQSPYVISYA